MRPAGGRRRHRRTAGRDGRVRAATTELIVVDRNSGLAISGFDPVAYFVDGVATPRQGRLEASFAGAVWRFRNEGNRAAFMADPEVYMPRFGGYDPVGVARGVAVPGDPRLWVLFGERLYLFSTPEGRERFVADADADRLRGRGALQVADGQASVASPISLVICHSDRSPAARAPTDRPRRRRPGAESFRRSRP